MNSEGIKIILIKLQIDIKVIIKKTYYCFPFSLTVNYYSKSLFPYKRIFIKVMLNRFVLI